jgi:hypothetical protein
MSYHVMTSHVQLIKVSCSRKAMQLHRVQQPYSYPIDASTMLEGHKQGELAVSAYNAEQSEPAGCTSCHQHLRRSSPSPCNGSGPHRQRAYTAVITVSMQWLRSFPSYYKVHNQALLTPSTGSHAATLRPLQRYAADGSHLCD